MELTMKKSFLALGLLSALGLQACNQQSTPAAQDTAAPAAAAPAATAGPSLDSSQQRLSYGLAYSMGMNFKTNDNLPDLDTDAFTAGLTDGLTGADPKMTEEEISAEMQAYQEKAMAEQQAAQAELAETNAALGAAFLVENGAREGVVTTESGLQYEILTAGEGPQPTAEDTVEVHYKGTLVDGTEFDSSYSRGETVSFGVGQVIPGWTEALQLMPVGSKWKLAIPSELAYGAGGAGQVIGPNAALVFEVELVSIPSEAAAEGDAAAEG